MKQLLIHTGYAKCASSSIQNFLTSNAYFESGGRSFRYVGFDKFNDLLDPSAIKSFAHYPPYCFTTNISADIDGLKKQMNSIRRCSSDVGIISNESLSTWLTPDKLELLSSLDIPIHLFVVVRPFVDWINSAWWQWGAFGPNDIGDWFNEYDVGIFPRSLRAWLRLPNLSQCTVVDLKDSPVEKLSRVLGLEKCKGRTVNSSSSAELLRFLIKHKDVVGRGVHKPLVEFIMNDELAFSGPKPGSIVTPERAKSILESYRKIEYGSSRELLAPIFESHMEHLEKNMRRFENGENVTSLKSFLAKEHSPLFLQAMCELLAKRSAVPYCFSATKYLYLHRDVKHAGIDPYEHYLNYGRSEGRVI